MGVRGRGYRGRGSSDYVSREERDGSGVVIAISSSMCRVNMKVRSYTEVTQSIRSHKACGEKELKVHLQTSKR